MLKVKIDYKRSHEGLWIWLAKNPDKDKTQWPGFRTMRDSLMERLPDNLCFACEYVGKTKVTHVRDCKRCPVYFGVKKNSEKVGYHCEVDGNYDSNERSFYVKWKKATKDSDRAKYAFIISQEWKKVRHRKVK